MPVDGGQPQQLLRGSSHSWDQTSRRIYYAIQSGSGDTRIEAADIDESSTGLSVGRTITIGFNTGVLHEFALAADGRRLLAAAVEESLNLTRVALAAGGAGVSGPRGRTEQRAGARSLPDVLPRWTARCRREQSFWGCGALGCGTRLDATEKGWSCPATRVPGSCRRAGRGTVSIWPFSDSCRMGGPTGGKSRSTAAPPRS